MTRPPASPLRRRGGGSTWRSRRSSTRWALPTPSGTRPGTPLVRTGSGPAERVWGTLDLPGTSHVCPAPLPLRLPPGVPRVFRLRSAGFLGLLACALAFAQPQPQRLPAPDGLTLAEAGGSDKRLAGYL